MYYTFRHKCINILSIYYSAYLPNTLIVNLNIYKKYIDGDRLIIDYPQKEIYSRENLAKKFYNILENYKKSQ